MVLIIGASFRDIRVQYLVGIICFTVYLAFLVQFRTSIGAGGWRGR